MKKLNNEGMTLVEILAAIIILSIVSIVFLRSFIYAFKVNEQAKEKQYSMILAQSLMESVKAYDLPTLDSQFSGPEASFKVYNLGASGTKSLSMSGAETRTYSLKDIVYQQAQYNDRYKYDVEILVEPVTDSAYHAHLVKAQDINPYSDAIYIEGDDEQAPLRDAIKTELATRGHVGTITTLDTTKISATRTVKVDITSDGAVTVKAVYAYSVNNYTITKIDGTTSTVSFTGTVDSPDSPSPCYDKSLIGEPSVTLQNLYLYYFPAYGTSVNQLIKCTSDKIEINNSCVTLQNVYLLKQENSALSTTQINTFESSYQPQVSINSPVELILLHNLRETMHTGTVLYPSISGNLMEYGTPWKDATDETTLLYNVTVKVKKSGASEPICELVGSTNAK